MFVSPLENSSMNYQKVKMEEFELNWFIWNWPKKVIGKKMFCADFAERWQKKSRIRNFGSLIANIGGAGSLVR